MKKIILLAAGIVMLHACKEEAKTDETVIAEVANYESFGDEIAADGAVSKEALAEIYANLKQGDTVEVKFVSEIKDVCQKKGCWMNVALNDDENAFVRFQDYGFFMPLNASGSEAVVNGKAFIDVVSVDELKHYAKDGGKSQEEIDAITEPKITYAFTANGVLIKE